MNKVKKFTKKEEMEFCLDLFYDIKSVDEAISQMREAEELASHIAEILTEGGVEV